MNITIEKSLGLLKQNFIRTNINNIVNFHNEVQFLLKKKQDQISQVHTAKDDTQLINEKLLKSAINHHHNYLTTNTFLMLYSLTEEWLFIFAGKPLNNGGGINRFNFSLINKGLKEDSPEWQALLQFEKVRNCILHANGRVSFVKKSDQKSIQNIINNKKYFSVKHDKLVLKKNYLQYVKNNILKVLDQFI